jgi:hypothetical protein
MYIACLVIVLRVPVYGTAKMSVIEQLNYSFIFGRVDWYGVISQKAQVFTSSL